MTDPSSPFTTDETQTSPHWTQALKTLLNQTWRATNAKPRVAVIGVGQALHGDDAAGITVVQRLTPCESLLILDGGIAPENQTGALRPFAPQIVLLVDAAHLGLESGAVRWLDVQSIGGVSASTHTFPLRLLALYLQQTFGCAIGLIAIQLGQDTLDAPLSPSVAQAVESVAAGLQSTLCG